MLETRHLYGHRIGQNTGQKKYQKSYTHNISPTDCNRGSLPIILLFGDYNFHNTASS